MSNLFLNIRFGEWHLQIGRDRPWVSFSRNAYQTARRATDPTWRWFAVYELPLWRAPTEER